MASASVSVPPGTDRARTSWRASGAVYTSRVGSTPTARRRRPTWLVLTVSVPASPGASQSHIAPVASDVPATTARYLYQYINNSNTAVLYFSPDVIRSHHLSLPQPFTTDLKLISFTNPFFHSISGLVPSGLHSRILTCTELSGHSRLFVL